MSIALKSVKSLFVIGIFLTINGFLPFITDPFNLPRMFIISITATFIAIVLLQNLEFFVNKSYKSIVILASLFFIWLTLSSFIGTAGVLEKVFGQPGRNTGLYTYFSFIIYMLFAMKISRSDFIKTFNKIILVSGLLTLIYGYMQVFKLDPMKWTGDFVKIFGFFGNPNFQSAFLALSAIASFAQLFDLRLKKSNKFLFLSYFFLTIYQIILTKSQQGLIVVAIGLAVVSYLNLRINKKFEKFIRYSPLIGVTLLILVLFDILQKTPWKSFLYKNSVAYRGDYWRAGWEITMDNPIFGVGVDMYRDNFRLYRDQKASFRDNSNTWVDSAHNIFLDISTNGGLPLILIYICFILLTIASINKIINVQKTVDNNVFILIAIWIGYTAQSIISISNIGLGVIGWTSMGLLLGFSRNIDRNALNNVKLKNSMLLSFIGVILSLMLLGNVVYSDYRFKSAINSRNSVLILNTSMEFPTNVNRLNLTSKLFRDNELFDLSLIVSKKSVELYPNSFDAWYEFSLLPNLSANEKILIDSKLNLLDPKR